MIGFFKKLFKLFFDSLQFNSRLPQYKDKKMAEDIKCYFNLGAFKRARTEFESNFFAYFRGYTKWKNGKFNDKKYNNILYYKYDEKYFSIYRFYNKFGFRQIKIIEITKNIYKKSISGRKAQTWCNIASGLWSRYFGIDNIQYYNGIEYSANALIKNIKSGLYNDDDFCFEECNREDGLDYAAHGGLCYAVWINPIGSGHIATLTGQGDCKNPEIIQAGKTCGTMPLKKGFGFGKRIKFYRLVKT
jgi:hypothetical protein